MFKTKDMNSYMYQYQHNGNVYNMTLKAKDVKEAKQVATYTDMKLKGIIEGEVSKDDYDLDED